MRGPLNGIEVLSKGLEAFSNIINTANNININSPEILLANEVSNQMSAYESSSKDSLKPSILGLYAHWFLSVIGLFESFFKCILMFILPLTFFLVWIALFLIYYIVLCFSCGRTDGIPVINNLMEKVWISVQNSSSLFFLYFGLVFGMICNIIIPWNAPVSFYKTQVVLKRPPPGPKHLQFQVECCNNLPVPKYIICKKFLIVGGCFHALSYSLFFENCFPLIVSEYEREVETDTIKFFQQTYNCQSFDQLLCSYGRGEAYQPTEPQIQQAYAVPVNPNNQATYVQVAYQVPN